MIDPKIKGKNVLITGANHGIGAATALKLAEQGANVFITYFRDKTDYSNEELQESLKNNLGSDTLYIAKQQQNPIAIMKSINQYNVKVFQGEYDLENERNILKLFDSVEDKLGNIDYLILNHTYCFPHSFDPEFNNDNFSLFDEKAKIIKKHYNVNSVANTLMIDEYVRRYKINNMQEGNIISFSTDAARIHLYNVSYAASKYAIESLSLTAAAELGHLGIRVNIISPGPIQTGYITPESEKSCIKNTPLRRLGEPDDVADVVVFLCSEQSRWITGQLIYVGGGHQLHQ